MKKEFIDRINTNDETKFIFQSNAIEGEWGEREFAHAMEAWEYLKAQDVLSRSDILKTHRLLMREQPIPKKYIGKIRDVQVWIGGREGLPYESIWENLHAWLGSMADVHIGADEEYLKRLHVQYEYIHPFIDGNGRTGRMFYNWSRIKAGLPIHVIYEHEKHDYYKWFQKETL